MKKIQPGIVLIVLLFLAVIAGLVYLVTRDTREKLYVYTWDTYAASDLFKKFEDETNISVITEVYSSNDSMLAKLKSGAHYDIITPSGNYVPLMIEENLLQPLPQEVRNIGRRFTSNVSMPAYDPEYTYALPLFYGTTGIAVNTKLTQEKITSWKQFFDRPTGEEPSIGMLDDTSTVMAIAALTLSRKNCDGSPETLERIQNLLTGQKPSVKTYSATGYFERLAANEVTLQMAWSGDVYTARQENDAIRYVYPSEGVELWMDSYAIPTNSQNPGAATKFIEFTMRPENAAEYATFSGNIPTVADAAKFLPPEMHQAAEYNIPKNTITFTSFACPADVVQAYGRIWENLLR